MHIHKEVATTTKRNAHIIFELSKERLKAGVESHFCTHGGSWFQRAIALGKMNNDKHLNVP